MAKQCKRVKAALLAAVLGIAISGMGEASFATQVIDRIVAVVNDEIITLAELNKISSPYVQEIEASGKSSTEKKELTRAVYQDILNKLIDRSLANQEAVKLNISVSDADVERAIENFKKLNGLDQDGLVKALEADGLTYEDYRERMRTDILQTLLINRAVRSRVIVTEADVKAYYDAHQNEFSGKRTYHLRNILTDSETAVKQVASLLEQNGSFAELAKQYSTASNAADGGDLGVVDINNFSDAVKNAVSPLKAGEHTGVIRTGQGFQIIYVEKVLSEGGTSFESVQDQIHELLHRQMSRDKFENWVKEIKENAHIKVML